MTTTVQANATNMKGIIPWSYSSLQAYETCPRRFQLTRLTKQVKEPQSASMAWGNEVHKALEDAVRGTQGLAYRFQAYQPLVTKILSSPGHKEAERNFALTDSFRPTDYWAKDAWVRGKADLTITYAKSATLLDWKTGKPKEDPSQLKLFAGVLLVEKPHVTNVRTGFVWLAHNKIDSEVVERAELPSIWQDFVTRVSRMKYSATHNDFPPRPSGLCREYCPVGNAMCEHCG